MNIPAILLIVVCVLSIGMLLFGLSLHRRLGAARQGFLSALHVEGSVRSPKRLGLLAWVYVVVTFCMLVLAVFQFLRLLPS